MSSVKWRKENTRMFVVRLTKNVDKDIIEYMESIENKNNYLRSLIRQDMERTKKLPEAKAE